MDLSPRMRLTSVHRGDTRFRLSALFRTAIGAPGCQIRNGFSEAYTQRGLSINAIARMLNERQIPTRTVTTRWERSTVWGMLRNPAYCGKACYGKTELRPRQRITRPLRQGNGVASRDSANHETARTDLRGGWAVMLIPTATPSADSAAGMNGAAHC